MPTRSPSQGVSAPIVTNIPEQWSPAWFRQFIINYLEPADVRNAQAGDGISIQPASTGLYKYPSTAIISASGTQASLVLTAATPVVAASQVGFGNTLSASATGGGITPPSQVLGYLVVNIAGTNVKVPYYAN